MIKIWLVVAAMIVLVAAPLRAEDEPPLGNSYLPLYPTGDVYNVVVIGDGIAEGLVAGLTDALRGETRASVRPKALELSALMRPEQGEQVKALDDALGREPFAVAVVMIGPQDRVTIKGPQGKKISIDHDDWRAEFSRQVDGVMKVLKRRKMAVYWVSLPNVRNSDANEDVQVLNDIIRERLLLNGLRYIDAYAGFTDESGGFSQMGPDLGGKVRRLREANGIAFTEAGHRKLAHFVEREFKRDLAQAKTDRTIPLAGAESEQAAINASARAAKAAAGSPVVGGAGGAAFAGLAAGAPAGAQPGEGEQKADSGRINLAVSGAGGREEIIAIDLLRPAIPATVIALVNRKENAERMTQLGDLLVDQIAGGVVVMSSITAAGDGSSLEARRKLSPTQTPYFRVMVKGERIAPRAGRADDTSWPRAEPPPLAELAPAPVKPAAAPVPVRAPGGPKAKKADTDAR